MSEEFDYMKWLNDLKQGDRIKTSQCRHNYSCHCKDIKVASIVEMFGQPAVMVQDGCTLRYFSKENGRELGTRKGVYKLGTLSPWTERDTEIEARKEEEALQEEEARALGIMLAIKLKGYDPQDNFSNTLKNYMTIEEMKAALSKL